MGGLAGIAEKDSPAWEGAIGCPDRKMLGAAWRHGGAGGACRVSVSNICEALLRQAPERTVDELWRRIGALLDQFTSDECRNRNLSLAWSASSGLIEAGAATRTRR